MAQKTLSVKLELLTKDFSKNLNSAVGQVITSTQKMTSSIQSLGAKMSVAFAIPATLLGKTLLKMAGDAEDATSKFKAIFADSAPQVEKSIINLSEVFSRNTTDLKNYASEFGSMYTSMNLNEEEAGNLSRSMVQLGLDVANLRGVSDSKVMDLFTQSLTGNVRGLRQLGISISDADIQNEAFLMGINKSVGDLSERDKALIMTSLLQKAFAKDIGSVSKSQKDWGEVIKQFNAKVKTLGELFGKELIPMISSLIDKIEPLIRYFTELEGSAKKGAMTLIAFAVLLPPLITVLGTIGSIIVIVISAFFGLARAITTAIFAIGLFIQTQLAKFGLTFTGVLKSMALGFVNLAMVVVPVVVIIGSLVQILRMAIRFWALMAGLIADNANVIVKIFTPAILVLIQSVKGLVFAFTYAKNALDGHESAYYRAGEAIKDLTKIQKDLTDAFLGNKDSSDVANILSANLYKVEEAMNGTAESLDSMLLSVNQKVQNAFGASADWIKVKMGGAFDYVADKAKIGFGKSLDFMKDLAIGALALIGEFDPFKNFKKDKPAGTKEKPAKIPAPKPSGSFLDNFSFEPVDEDENVPVVPDIPPPPLTLWEEFEKHIKDTMITTSDVVKGAWDNVVSNFSSGISQMILEGASFADIFKNIWKSLADTAIQMIIKMGLQWLVTELMKRSVSATTSKIVQSDAIKTAVVATTASVTSSETMIGNNAVVAGSGAASSQSSIPIIGPILAIAAMGTMIAAVMALKGKLKLASGGITTGPTNALIGEKGREAVIPLDRLDSMIGNREQTIIMNVDGRTLARSVIQNSPREIRLFTGVTM